MNEKLEESAPIVRYYQRLEKRTRMAAVVLDLQLWLASVVSF